MDSNYLCGWSDDKDGGNYNGDDDSDYMAMMATMIVIMAMMVATQAAGQVLWWDSGGWRVYASRPLLIMFLHASNSISLRTKQSWWGNGNDYSDYNEFLVLHVYALETSMVADHDGQW